MKKENRMLHIVIDAREGQRVRFNLPMEILELMLDIGMELPEFSQSPALKDLDLEELVNQVRQGACGVLMERKTEDGDKIRVRVTE